MKKSALLLALATLVPAQDFEVASIHPAMQDGKRDSDVDNGRFLTHNLTLKRLIAIGWDIDESEILGGPNWVDSDSWDINAKIPTEYASKRSPEQFQQMVQNLLASRFLLKIHREPRQISGYALILAKTGSKMTIAKPSATGSDFSSHNNHLKATHVTMDAFARHLSRDRDISKLVVDRTGLTGNFDFDLQWARADDTSDDRPPIFSALQEELGLKLESARVPIQAVVIDRAERPEGN